MPGSFRYFLSCFLAASISLRQTWAEGKAELAACRHRADSGQEKDRTYISRHGLDRPHASTD